MYSLPLLLFICAYFSTFANLVYMPFSIFSTEQDIKFVSSFSVYLQFSETAIYYVMSISYDLKLLMSAHAIFCFVLLQIKKLGQSYLFMQFFLLLVFFLLSLKRFTCLCWNVHIRVNILGVHSCWIKNAPHSV